MIKLDVFFEQRHTSWKRLESLLNRTQKNVATLSEEELDDLGHLYRTATSDLAVAQRDFPNQKVTTYLNQLVGRAHTQVYRSEPMRWAGLRTFYLYTFPQLYRALLPYTILATLLLFVPAFIAFLIVWEDPDIFYIFQGDSAAVRHLVREVEHGKLWIDIPPNVRSTASAGILTNNIQVVFLTFAGSITGGLFSLWILILNGLHLGAVFGLLQAHGLSAGLGEFVLAHGFIELSVIVFAGSCALYVGDGLIRPGLLTRGQALIQRGREGVLAILACAPLLVIAGLIEGYISPSGLPWIVKLLVGLSTGIALYYYWLRTSRTAEV